MSTFDNATARLGIFFGIGALAASSVLQAQPPEKNSWTVKKQGVGMEFRDSTGSHIVLERQFPGMPEDIAVRVYLNPNVYGECSSESNGHNAKAVVVSAPPPGVSIGEEPRREAGTIPAAPMATLGQAIDKYNAHPTAQAVNDIAAAEAAVENATNNCGAGHAREAPRNLLASGDNGRTSVSAGTGASSARHVAHAPLLQGIAGGVQVELPQATVSFLENDRGTGPSVLISMKNIGKLFQSDGRNFAEYDFDAQTKKLSAPMNVEGLHGLISPIFESMAHSHAGEAAAPAVVEYAARLAEVAATAPKIVHDPSPVQNSTSSNTNAAGNLDRPSAMRNGHFYVNDSDTGMKIVESLMSDNSTTVTLSMGDTVCPNSPGTQKLYQEVETYSNHAHANESDGSDYARLNPAQENADFTAVIQTALTESRVTRACTVRVGHKGPGM